MRFPPFLNTHTLKSVLRKPYSDWIRKVPPMSQFSADIEGEPYRTTVTIENQSDVYLFVDSYAEFGFKLNNGFRILGPCALFPKTALAWNIGGPEEIHLASLSLFTVLEPKLDLLVVGVGEPEAMELVDRNLYKDLKSKGIGLELLTTHQACATFNFLNGERRCVAAALFPPTTMPSRNLDEGYLLPENFDNAFERERDYYIDADTGERLDIKSLQQQLPKKTYDKMPEQYSDSPDRPRRLSDRKPKDKKPQLPDGSKDE